MAILATLHGDARAADRHDVETKATLRPADTSPVDILVANMSATGCLFVCSEALDVGAAVTIGIAGLGRLPARIVRAQGSRYGASFETPVAIADITDAVALPINTVVSFPIEMISNPVTDDNPPEIEKLGVRSRIILLAALTAASWCAILGVALLRR